MLDLRKFPLFHALFPFICGLLLSYGTRWPFAISAGFALIAFLCSCWATIRKPSWYVDATQRLLLSVFVWFAAGLFVFSLNDFRSAPNGIHRYLNREIMVSGEILEVKKGIGGRGQLLLETDRVVVGNDVSDCSGKLIISVKDDRQTFTCGDLIIAGGVPEAVVNPGNPGEFDAAAFYRSRKISGSLFTGSMSIQKTGNRQSLNSILTDWRNYLANNMEEYLDGTFLAISKALILGDKSDLDAETIKAFSTTGSMHVLAVSGLHIGLILLLLQRILQLFSRWITKYQSIVIAIILIWIYGGITGASPAVMRAVVMFSILSGAQLFRRQTNPLNVLGFSAIVLLCYDPWMLFDLGFQLSYAAMLGIFLLYKPIAEAWTPTGKWVRMTWEGTAVGFAATVLTTPLILYWFYQFPNYFALANLGVMLFGFLVLMLGMFFLFTNWIPFVVKLVAVVFAFSIFGLVVWVEWVDSLPGAVSGGFHLSGWEVLIAYLLIASWILHLQLRKGKRRNLIFASLLLVGWWTADRAQVVQTREWIVFNDNRFVTAVKVGGETYGFYDCKWTGSWKIPTSLEAYARYSGSNLHLIPLYHKETKVRLDGRSWHFSKVKDGIHIISEKKKWFYRTDGTPDANEKRSLMTTRLQLYLDPGRPAGPFVTKY